MLRPLLEWYFLQRCLHCLYVALLLHPIGDALEARLLPLVAFAVLLEVSSETSFVLCSLIPYGAVRYFVEQQSVVVFADEALQRRVGSSHLVSTAVEYVLRCALRYGMLSY